MKKTCAAILLLAGLLGACHPSGPDQSAEHTRTIYEVEKVLDGDSLLARSGQHTIEVRLFGIDAPEHDQPFAKKSKQLAERLLNKKQITVEQKDTDRYGRIVALIYLDGQEGSVNAILVEQGAAWVYRRYTNDKALIEKENQAKSSNRGLWSLPQNQQIPPWEWRKKPRP